MERTLSLSVVQGFCSSSSPGISLSPSPTRASLSPSGAGPAAGPVCQHDPVAPRQCADVRVLPPLCQGVQASSGMHTYMCQGVQASWE